MPGGQTNETEHRPPGSLDGPAVVWGVEVGEYENTHVVVVFTTEELANEYAAQNGGDVLELSLFDRPVVKVPYWHYGAEVYPDGTVRRFAQRHESNEPGMEPVDRAERLHDRPEPWDGHTQGHCGYHVSVFGSDKSLVEQARERWVAKYLKLCNGKCPGCGRQGPYQTDWWGPR